MSNEFEAFQTAPSELILAETPRNNVFRKMVTVVALGATVLAGCGRSTTGGGSTPSKSEQSATVLTEEQCLSTPESNSLSLKTSSPEAFFPSLSTSKGELDTASEAESTLIETICSNDTSLAVFAALNEYYTAATLPNGDLPSRVKQLHDLWQTDPTALEKAKKDVYTLLTYGIKPTENFAVTAGAVNQLVANRQNGRITGVSLIQPDINSSATTLKGYLLNFNIDNNNLSAVQKNNAEKLDMLILIGEDGTIYFNSLISKNVVSAQFAVSNTKVNTTPKGSQNIQAFQGTGNNQGVSRGTVPESNPNGPKQGPGNGPSGAGTTPEAGPGRGNTPGTGGGNQSSGETTTTITSSTVPVVTIPPTTTTTAPESTTTTTTAPESTTTTTTVPDTKGKEPCNPNLGETC